MKVNTEFEPYVELLPGFLQTPSRLICHVRWTDEATQAFMSGRFDCLGLRGGEFALPELGNEALSLEQLVLDSSGEVKGLEQFRNLQRLTVAEMPANGLDLSLFPHLRELSFEREKDLERQLPRIDRLESVIIDKFSGKDCRPFSRISKLRSLWLAQGGLHSLRGLENCPRLEQLELAYIRNLSDVAALQALKGLKKLSLANLPKASGRVEVRHYPDLQYLKVVECKQLALSLSGLKSLKQVKKLWSNIPVDGFDWEDLFQLPCLAMVGLMADDNMPDDPTFRALAEQAGRRLETIRHVGSRRSRAVQLLFSPEN